MENNKNNKNNKYNKVISYIEQTYSFNKLGVEKFEEFMQSYCNKAQKLKVIHVAGTNGKGSVCAMLSSVLQEQGYKVGLFTSPHLIDIRERFQINKNLISKDELVTYVEQLQSYNITLSFFEMFTAIAFKYFVDKNVDYAIIEVGIGGRLDSTNFIKQTMLSVISSVSIDHTELLGDSIEEISREKSGIIKKNCPIVLCFQSDKVYNIVNSYANLLDAKLYYSNYYASIVEYNKKVFINSIKSEYYEFENLEFNLLGKFQIDNLATTLLSICALRNAGVAISDLSVYNGIKNVEWKGRMEVLSNEPLFLVDVAHNVDGIDRLIDSINQIYPNKKITFVAGMLKDKNYADMINKLNENCHRLIITSPSYKNRAVSANELYQRVVNKNKNIIVEEDLQKAIDIALEYTDGLICCTGSLYLISDILTKSWRNTDA